MTAIKITIDPWVQCLIQRVTKKCVYLHKNTVCQILHRTPISLFFFFIEVIITQCQLKLISPVKMTHFFSFFINYFSTRGGNLTLLVFSRLLAFFLYPLRLLHYPNWSWYQGKISLINTRFMLSFHNNNKPNFLAVQIRTVTKIQAEVQYNVKKCTELLFYMRLTSTLHLHSHLTA